MPATSYLKVFKVSQEYLDGYHAGKDMFKMFDAFHYFRYMTSEDYRLGYTRSINNNYRKKGE